MKDLIVIKNDEPILAPKMIANLIEIDKLKKELKEREDKYKKAIKEAMEKENIIKISDETSGISISYIAEQTNMEKFNKDKFQEENPDLYDKYVTMDGKKAAYITIRTK